MWQGRNIVWGCCNIGISWNQEVSGQYGCIIGWLLKMRELTYWGLCRHWNLAWFWWHSDICTFSIAQRKNVMQMTPDDTISVEVTHECQRPLSPCSSFPTLLFVIFSFWEYTEFGIVITTRNRPANVNFQCTTVILQLLIWAQMCRFWILLCWPTY